MVSFPVKGTLRAWLTCWRSRSLFSFLARFSSITMVRWEVRPFLGLSSMQRSPWSSANRSFSSGMFQDFGGVSPSAVSAATSCALVTAGMAHWRGYGGEGLITRAKTFSSCVGCEVAQVFLLWNCATQNWTFGGTLVTCGFRSTNNFNNINLTTLGFNSFIIMFCVINFIHLQKLACTMTTDLPFPSRRGIREELSLQELFETGHAGRSFSRPLIPVIGKW